MHVREWLYIVLCRMQSWYNSTSLVYLYFEEHLFPGMLPRKPSLYSIKLLNTQGPRPASASAWIALSTGPHGTLPYFLWVSDQLSPLSGNLLWNGMTLVLIIFPQGKNSYGRMRFGPWSKKVITTIIIDALKFMMWSRVAIFIKLVLQVHAPLRRLAGSMECQEPIPCHTQSYSIILKSP